MHSYFRQAILAHKDWKKDQAEWFTLAMIKLNDGIEVSIENHYTVIQRNGGKIGVESKPCDSKQLYLLNRNKIRVLYFKYIYIYIYIGLYLVYRI